MVLEAPLFMQGNTYAARRLRELVGFIFDVEGVVKPETNALKVSPRAAGATMSVDVAAGTCAIRGDDQAAQGMYLCSSTEVANKPIGPAPGSGSRIDLVYAQLRDAAVTGGTASDWIIEVLPGDAVPSNPVPKAVPASAIPLAEVLVTSTTTSITGGITDRRTAATNAAYAPHAMLGSASRSAFSVPTGTLTTVTFNVESSDIGNLVDLATQPQRITIPEQRYWVATLQVVWASAVGNQRYAAVQPDTGGPVVTGRAVPVSGDSTDMTLVSIPFLRAAGSYVVCNLFHNAGAAVNADVHLSLHSVRKP